MHFSFSHSGTVFALLLALYVCLQSALTIIEVRRTERDSLRLPSVFARTVSLAEHRKAVDYNAELMQCDLVDALLGAALTVVFTDRKSTRLNSSH